MSSRRKSRTKIVNYKRHRKDYHINIGSVFLVILFLYFTIQSIIYITHDKISIYEVTKGSSETTENVVTTGLILRTETVTTAEAAGYINFYAKEGNRISVGETLYTIDESGALSKLLQEAAENGATISDENLSLIKEDISDFTGTFDNNNFSDVYDFKYSLDASLIESINATSLGTVNASLSEDGGTAVSIKGATRTGYVEYFTDGYESLTADQISSEHFDESKYKKKTIQSGSQIKQGDNIFKTIDSENWKIAVQLTDSQYEDYKDVDAVDVYFPSENINTSAYFSIQDNNGKHYGILDLTRYMTRFSERRFVDVEILGDVITGLKVPKSSVTTKAFYTVPIAYLTKGGASNDYGFNKEVVKDGATTVEFVDVDIISQDDEYCYVSKDSENIDKGNVIVKPDSTERFQIGPTQELKGVYNVNNGYTSFRYIKILSSKNDYYIVKSDTRYGLQVYDQIILDADTVKDNTQIFR